MTINCVARNPDKTNCPYINYCLARLNDPTITGCGLPLYMAGVINKDDVRVVHTIKEDHKGGQT